MGHKKAKLNPKDTDSFRIRIADFDFNKIESSGILSLKTESGREVAIPYFFKSLTPGLCNLHLEGTSPYNQTIPVSVGKGLWKYYGWLFECQGPLKYCKKTTTSLWHGINNKFECDECSKVKQVHDRRRAQTYLLRKNPKEIIKILSNPNYPEKKSKQLSSLWKC